MSNKVEIPTLDCGEIAGPLSEIEGTEAFQNFVQKLGDAMRDIGFVYLVNHCTKPQTVDHFNSKSREFFELPKDIKIKYRKLNPVEKFYGYIPPEGERLDEVSKSKTGQAPVELKEGFSFTGIYAHDEANFPVEVPGFKDALDSFRTSLSELAQKLLRCFAVYLSLEDKNYLIENHKALDDPTIDSQKDIRANYYHPTQLSNQATCDGNTIRLGEHCDWCTFTLLFQDEVGGLEAKMANGDWVPVNPIKDSIVLNAGLTLENWSGGLLPATYHRVRAIGNGQGSNCRQSVAYFVVPDDSAICTPLVPEKKGWTPAYSFKKTETYIEFARNRIRAAY